PLLPCPTRRSSDLPAARACCSDPYSQSIKVTNQRLCVRELHRLPACCMCAFDVFRAVVNEQGGGGIEAEGLCMVPVDRHVGLDEPDVGRDCDTPRALEKWKAFRCFPERVGGEVGKHRDVAPGIDQRFHDGDAVFIGMRYHFMPEPAEIADILLVGGMQLDQQRLGLFPGPTAVLLKI